MNTASPSFLSKAAMALLLAGSVTLGGCAMLDGLMGVQEVQAVNDDDAALFVDAAGNPTTEAVGADGKPNEPLMVREKVSNGVIGAAPDLLSMLGPWGALAGAVLAGAGGIYTRLRTGASDAKAEAAEAAGRFLIMLIEKIKTGVADVFIDGKLDQGKLRDWLRAQGKEFSDPAYLEAMVKAVTKGL